MSSISLNGIINQLAIAMSNSLKATALRALLNLKYHVLLRLQVLNLSWYSPRARHGLTHHLSALHVIGSRPMPENHTEKCALFIERPSGLLSSAKNASSLDALSKQ